MKKSAALNKIVELPVSAIQESKFPLRRFYDEQALKELGESIEEIGRIYPVVVRPISKAATKFELIIGSRRLKSAQRRKERSIGAVILSDIDDRQSLILALSENLKRQDLNPFEEANAFLALLKDFKMSEKELAKRVSCTEQYIRQRLKLLSLPPKVQELIVEGKLGLDKVTVIASLPEKQQLKYAQTAVNHALTDSEFSTLAARDGLKKSAVSRRKKPERFTGKRVSLKIYAFAEWLKGSEAHIVEMSRSDRNLIKEALDALLENAGKIAKNPAVAGQAGDLAKAMGRIRRTSLAS